MALPMIRQAVASRCEGSPKALHTIPATQGAVMARRRPDRQEGFTVEYNQQPLATNGHSNSVQTARRPVKHIKTPEDFASGFDTQMLIEDARATAPEFSWLPAALTNCGVGKWESRAYVRYISAINPNQPESEWQFRTSVTLHHRSLGMVVIDILQGDRIGGIEFLDWLD